MNKNVQPQLLLQFNAVLNPILHKLVVLFLGDRALFKIGARHANLGGLWERTDRRSREQGQLKAVFLHFLTLRKFGQARMILFGKLVYTVMDGGVFSAACFVHQRRICFEFGGFPRIVRCGDLLQLGKLAQLFLRERKVLFHILRELCFVFKSIGNVQQRAGGVQHNLTAF